MTHPTKRLLQHVRWLCKWFGGDSVIDPFMGSGTAALACKNLGISFTGMGNRGALLWRSLRTACVKACSSQMTPFAVVV